MKLVLKVLALLALILAVVLVGRALLLRPEDSGPGEFLREEVPQGAVDRFAGSLRFPTVSNADPTALDPEAFRAFRQYLERSFPGVHRTLDRELVGEHSLLFTWRGSDPSLLPVILLAHQDVVPVEEGAEGDWIHPPFSGEVMDGLVWGRGAMDDKGSLMAILEAAEALLSRRVLPRRTLIFAFGHDEEVGGLEGARAMADLLQARGVRAAYVLDEGMAIVEDVLPGVEIPVALVGLAEKGYLSLHLSVERTGGHSSTPPSETAVGILARAISRLEEEQMPARLEGPPRMLLETVGPHASFGVRIAVANLWLFEGFVARLMAASPETAAAVRTTTAPTIVRAGVKDNVLPRQAEAVLNFRILPGDSVQGVIAHVEQTIGDARVHVEVYQGLAMEPSSVSDPNGFGYREIRATVREVFPGVEVAPFLSLAGTDSKHFVDVAQDVYRFAPFWYRPELASGIHGTNERIPVEDYLDMVRFYLRLLGRSGR